MTHFQRACATILSALTLSTIVALAPANAALTTTSTTSITASSDSTYRDFGRRIIWIA
ncbi:MAG TPA: hypothetical protein H9987_06520 [Candidatus Luteococcus avicola]|nr:hypothetical protein [Candidatus Luteococcus avicola]